MKRPGQSRCNRIRCNKPAGAVSLALTGSRALSPAGEVSMKTLNAGVLAVAAALAILLSWNSMLSAGEVIEKSKGAPDSRVVLFSQPFCPGCEAAKYYFHDNQISYLEFDITASRAARDTFERLGGRGTPFFLIGGQRLHGFSIPRLEQLLSELGIPGGSHE